MKVKQITVSATYSEKRSVGQYESVNPSAHATVIFEPEDGETLDQSGINEVVAHEQEILFGQLREIVEDEIKRTRGY